MKRIDSSYKLIEFLSGRRSGTDTVVNVVTIEFRFRAIVLIEKFVLDVAYEKIGVAAMGTIFSYATSSTNFSINTMALNLNSIVTTLTTVSAFESLYGDQFTLSTQLI